MEVCNDYDDDCDGEIDEDLVIGLYFDADGDGYGDPNRPSEDCTGGNGYVSMAPIVTTLTPMCILFKKKSVMDRQ